MNEPKIGQRVITDRGEGVVETITTTHCADDILRYHIVSGTERHWHYLDEIIVVPEPATTR